MRLLEYAIKSNILGNTKAFKEASDVLVWWLPWKPPSSDHSLTVHRLCLTAEDRGKNSNDILTSSRKEQ